MIPVVDNTNGVIQTTSGGHIVVSSSFRYVYYRSFSAMVLYKLWLLGIVASIENAFFDGFVRHDCTL